MKKPDNSSILNVCLIPSEGVSKLCEQASQSLKSKDTMFVLGDGKFAHMTVFMARFANQDIEKVAKLVDEAVAEFKTFDCTHKGFFITDGRYYEVSYAKSEPLMKLQQTLIDKISSLRINPGRPFEESYFAPYNEQQQQNAAQTGYDLAGDLYRPHVTLTRYNEGCTPKEITMPDDMDLSFKASKICLYLADDNGAVYEKIAGYNLL